MKQYYVFSLMGPDRPGLVDRVSQAVVNSRANLEDSRMAVLGAEFVIMMLCSVAAERSDLLKEELARACQELGLVMTVKATRARPTTDPHVPLAVRVQGLDHEGIVHQVARYLVEQGGSVESLESQVSPAPHTGTPMFSMEVRLAMPASTSVAALREHLEHLGHSLDVDVEVLEPAPLRA